MVLEDASMSCPGGTCRLLGPFGLLVQAFIGMWCFLTLVILWKIEKYPRPFFAWLGDMSKQMVGATYGHLMNLILAMLFGDVLEEDATKNQCVWYMLAFLSDIIFVTFLGCLATRAARPLVRRRCGMDIGDYGGEEASLAVCLLASTESSGATLQPRKDEQVRYVARLPPWLLWCCQTAIWLLILTAVKTVVSVGLYFGQGPLYAGLTWVFSMTGLCGHHRRQLAVSVIVVPVIGDALQFAVQDGFLKKQEPHSKYVEIAPAKGAGVNRL
jgi:hypothetical protein